MVPPSIQSRLFDSIPYKILKNSVERKSWHPRFFKKDLKTIGTNSESPNHGGIEMRPLEAME
ncbi:hypothetical protein AM1_4491 [Acaryochloris marina MBIC11017]|uniref:Uncharacterized protein n=1 Tax=Acaryochloris marina (strain MBIC 11017) TaxID=329726 RepID=B0CG21_ACAM1|nr:hypothetical protein AM1_4491 [Acaryochloris marina MBIC11017]